MICFPLNNVEYQASALGAWCGTRTRGVFSGNDHYKTTANGNMTVTVSPGIAWLKAAEYWGVCVYESEPQVLNVNTAHTSLPRISTVCLRLDKNLNVAEFIIKDGTNNVNPVIPSMNRDLNYDELYVATIRVRAGATKILPEDITDQRLNETYCGIMRDGVTSIPTDMLNEQFQGFLNEINAELSRINNGTEVLTKSVYDPQLRQTDIFEYVDTAANHTDSVVKQNSLLVGGQYGFSNLINLKNATGSLYNFGEQIPIVYSGGELNEAQFFRMYTTIDADVPAGTKIYASIVYGATKIRISQFDIIRNGIYVDCYALMPVLNIPLGTAVSLVIEFSSTSVSKDKGSVFNPLLLRAYTPLTLGATDPVPNWTSEEYQTVWKEHLPSVFNGSLLTGAKYATTLSQSLNASNAKSLGIFSNLTDTYSSTTNCNDLPDGVFNISSTAANGVGATAALTCISINNRQYVAQTALQYSNNVMKHRTFNGTSWTAWKTVTSA